MEKWLILTLFIIAVPFASAQVVVGNIRTDPDVIMVSTTNLTLIWASSDLATSFINCTAPGFSLPMTPVEQDLVTTHSFFMNTSFTADGPFGCTIYTYPSNGTPFATDYFSRVNCEGVRLEAPEPSVATAAYFTRPKGSGPYELNVSVKVRNACVGRAEVALSASPPSGFGMSAQPAVAQGLQTAIIPLTIVVPDSTPEGPYFGSVAFSSQGSFAAESVNITVHWPGPKLSVQLNQIGNVRSGTTITWYADISEALGYRAANGVNCSVWFSDKNQAPQESALGKIEPFGKARCAFSMAFPERKAAIGNYTAWVRVESYGAGGGTFSTNYTIPIPYMAIIPSELDLGRLTFDSGSDDSVATLSVLENGGYTPLEGIKFRLVEGDGGWVSLPDCSYAPPGGRENCTFRVTLNENASIGVKSWSFGVSSDYTKEIIFRAHAEIYFIGIDDAILQLQGMSNFSVVRSYNQAETLRVNGITMLEGLRGGNNSIQEISSVIAVHGGAVSLLSQMEGAQASSDRGDDMGAGRSLLSARMALERISSSFTSAKAGAQLEKAMEDVYVAAGGFWSASSAPLLARLELEAASDESSNYRSSAELYVLLSRIYAQSDQDKSALLASRASVMEQKYEQSVENAGEAKLRANSSLSTARSGTALIGGARIILNPISHEGVAQEYKQALTSYDEAIQQYRNAGQQGELNRLLSEEKSAEAEYTFMETAFSVGSVAASILLIIVIMRSITGMQRYREDEDDVETGGVMVR